MENKMMRREKSIEKQSRKWISILGLLALGVFTMGCDDYDDGQR